MVLTRIARRLLRRPQSQLVVVSDDGSGSKVAGRWYKWSAVNPYSSTLPEIGILQEDGVAGDKTLSAYAMAKRVIPVSPNSFYAYLQAIVLGLKGLKIESRAKEIGQYLSRLESDLGKFREDFNLVGKHLGHAQACFQSSEKRLEQFGQKLLAAGEKEELPEPL